jgi:hypothetical protein
LKSQLCYDQTNKSADCKSIVPDRRGKQECPKRDGKCVNRHLVI